MYQNCSLLILMIIITHIKIQLFQENLEFILRCDVQCKVKYIKYNLFSIQFYLNLSRGKTWEKYDL